MNETCARFTLLQKLALVYRMGTLSIIIILLLQDTQLVIERYKSGFVPPEDFQFEAAAGADTTDAATTHHPHNHLTAARGTVSGNRIKKRGGLLSIFSSNKVRTTYLFYENIRWSG